MQLSSPMFLRLFPDIARNPRRFHHIYLILSLFQVFQTNGHPDHTSSLVKLGIVAALIYRNCGPDLYNNAPDLYNNALSTRTSYVCMKLYMYFYGTLFRWPSFLQSPRDSTDQLVQSTGQTKIHTGSHLNAPHRTVVTDAVILNMTCESHHLPSVL